jgi:uncharacterized membrane protein YfcA
MDLQSTVAGLLVGFLVGLTGIGGGALMTPILVLIFGTAAKTAVGTDLIFAALTKIAGVSIHGRRGTIDWQVVRRLACGSIPAAVVTGLFIHRFGKDAARANHLIMTVMGIMLLVTALGLLTKPWLHRLGRSFRLGDAEKFKAWQGPLTVLAGVLLGTVVTLTSIGAGALGTVIMLYLYPLRLTPAKVVGTDLAHAIPLALVAGAGHLFLGNVDYHLLLTLITGSIPGVLLGSWLSTSTSDAVLRPVLATLLLLTGVKILVAG